MYLKTICFLIQFMYIVKGCAVWATLSPPYGDVAQKGRAGAERGFEGNITYIFD